MRPAVPPRATESRSQAAHSRPVRDLVEAFARISRSLAEPGEALDLANRPFKSVVLLPGNHGKVVVDEDDSTVVFAPGAWAEQLEITAPCSVFGAAIDQPAGRSGAAVDIASNSALLNGLRVDTVQGPCISISAASRAVVTNSRLSQPEGTYMVLIDSGGKAIFTGVILGPSSSTVVNAVYNAGVAANVDITGVVKSVSAGHTNVTTISEV